jgi:hypothetical protein
MKHDRIQAAPSEAMIDFVRALARADVARDIAAARLKEARRADGRLRQIL